METKTEMQDLKVTAIEESPFNQRKVYKGLNELAESIKMKGVLQPILVRPVAKGWQLVTGHRRLRASKLAGRETIPATIRDLSDAEVIEIQVIENIQRSDVTPLEEAEAYDSLIKKYKRTVVEIAAKVGRSTAYVYQRLKLADLPARAKDAVSTGSMDLSVALAIARIPNPELRKDAANVILEERNHYSSAAETHVSSRMSSAEAVAFIRSRYTLTLADAGFDLDDETLVPKAGACTKCPFRTKNSPMLFPDFATKEDLCSSPTCFADKRSASWKRTAAAAAAKGAKVIDDKQAKAVFYDHGKMVRSDSAFADIETESYSITGDKTWKAALGSKLLKELQPIVAQAPTGEVVHLVDKAAALELLKQNGKAPKTRNDHAFDDSAERRKRKAKRSASLIATSKIVEKVCEVGLTLEVARAIVTSWMADYGGVRWIESRIGSETLKKETAGLKSTKKDARERDLALGWIEQASLKDLAGVLVEISIDRTISEWNPVSDTLLAWCKRYRIDLEALQKAAAAEAKASAKKKGGK